MQALRVESAKHGDSQKITIGLDAEVDKVPSMGTSPMNYPPLPYSTRN